MHNNFQGHLMWDFNRAGIVYVFRSWKIKQQNNCSQTYFIQSICNEPAIFENDVFCSLHHVIIKLGIATQAKGHKKIDIRHVLESKILVGNFGYAIIQSKLIYEAYHYQNIQSLKLWDGLGIVKLGQNRAPKPFIHMHEYITFDDFFRYQVVNSINCYRVIPNGICPCPNGDHISSLVPAYPLIDTHL